MRNWLKWLLRRGERGTLVLNMRPGDEVACMCVYRDWVAVVSKGGEYWLIDQDQFVNSDEIPTLTAIKA